MRFEFLRAFLLDKENLASITVEPYYEEHLGFLIRLIGLYVVQICLAMLFIRGFQKAKKRRSLSSCRSASSVRGTKVCQVGRSLWSICRKVAWLKYKSVLPIHILSYNRNLISKLPIPTPKQIHILGQVGKKHPQSESSEMRIYKLFGSVETSSA